MIVNCINSFEMTNTLLISALVCLVGSAKAMPTYPGYGKSSELNANQQYPVDTSAHSLLFSDEFDSDSYSQTQKSPLSLVHLEKRMSLAYCQNPAYRMPIPFMDSNKLIESLELSSLSMSLDSDGEIVGKVSSEGVKVNMAKMSGWMTSLIDMDFNKMKQEIELIPDGSTTSVAKMAMPWTDVQGSLRNGMVLNMNNLDLQVTDPEAFTTFLQTITFYEGPLNVTMKGKAEVQARRERTIGFGRWTKKMGLNVCLTDMTFSKKVVIYGMAGLSKGQVLGIPAVVTSFASAKDKQRNASSVGYDSDDTLTEFDSSDETLFHDTASFDPKNSHSIVPIDSLQSGNIFDDILSENDSLDAKEESEYATDDFAQTISQNSIVQTTISPEKHKRAEPKQAVYLEIPFELENPSNVYLQTGEINAHLIYKEQIIGQIILDSLDLKPQTKSNAMTVKAIVEHTSDLNAEALSAIKDLFSNFANGKSSEVAIQGHENSSKVSYLSKVLSHWTFNTAIPGLPSEFKLVDEAIFGIPNLLNMIAACRIWTANPFQVPIRINGIKGVMKSANTTTTIGIIDQKFKEGAFVMAPLEKRTASPKLELKVLLQASLISELVSKGKLKVDLETELDVWIGDFPTVLSYKQSGLDSLFKTNAF